MEMACEGFCYGGKNTDFGMAADRLSLIFGNALNVKGRPNDDHPCPLGFTHNPTSEQSTKNMISNGGRHSICQNNQWKWATV